MQWIKFLCVTALLLALASANSNVSDDFSDTQSSDVDSKRIRIDPTLRKALLRALRHLKERQEEESDQLNDSNTTEENFATTLLDEILEESTNSDRESSIRYHSYEADANSDNGGNEIIKTIIISKPKTTLLPPKVDLLREIAPDPIKERENDVDSNQVARSVASGSSNSNNLDVTKDEKSSIAVVTPVPSIVSTQVTPTVTSPTTSTTTPKAPTHNADGENIEKVKSEDVKIYQAPLVAAFTVQQDQQGVPRNVIPLLQVPSKKAPVDFNVATSTAPMIIPIGQFQASSNQNQAPPTASTQSLEEKTRLLEQQLLTLQTQQRIQEQLLRSKIIQEQQIILQQQQQLQQQRFRLEEETRIRLQKFEEEQRLFRQQQQQLQHQQLKLQQQQPLFKPFPVQQQPNNQQIQQQQQFQQQQHQQQQFQQQQHQQFQQQQQQQQQQQFQQQQQQPQFVQELPRNGPAVQFIPSISLPGKSIPISVEQQLPFKEPVEFQPVSLRNTFVEQVKSISPPSQQFPIIPPSPPQLSKQQLLPLKPFQPFNVNPFPVPLANQAQLPLDQQLPHLQRNRVFRHESDTGNFGFNSQPQQQPNVPFRPSQQIPIIQLNGGFQPLRNDNQLQNLLVQSGITSRSAEDFNIITKVLALNHGIPQSSSQLMFAKLSPEQQQQLLFRKK
ncbi:alpha-protein kinase 1-like [Topomyia yanbarensis]|uniref:alpha-protein kinase 1-like n=1 Tax=Topomyia yanbarensis TaxID=2498891 RepID=UPI00273BEABF|nr:alpha-protein kinase 1-like [Topomyia yanbarensis]